MKNPYEIIIRPAMTEKTTDMAEDDKYAFRVRQDATKNQIRGAVEALFGVDVIQVNTMNMPSKPKRVGLSRGRRSGWKKAIVTVAKDQAIDLFALEGEDLAGEV